MKAFYESRTYNLKIPVHAFNVNDMNFLAHWHKDVELAYVCDGEIRVGVNNTTRMLHKGDLAIFSSSDIHFYNSTGLRSSMIVILFEPGFIGSSRLWPDGLRFDTPFIEKSFIESLEGGISKRIQDTLYSIVEEADKKRDYYDVFIKSRLLELCAIALRHFPSSKSDAGVYYKQFPYMKSMRTALEFLESNYSANISLEELAGLVNLSPCYFSRLFNHFTGMSFKKYLNTIRVEKAESMLKSGGGRTMAQIAFESGFNSIRTFNREYKIIKGITPRQSC